MKVIEQYRAIVSYIYDRVIHVTQLMLKKTQGLQLHWNMLFSFKS